MLVAHTGTERQTRGTTHFYKLHARTHAHASSHTHIQTSSCTRCQRTSTKTNGCVHKFIRTSSLLLFLFSFFSYTPAAAKPCIIICVVISCENLRKFSNTSWILFSSCKRDTRVRSLERLETFVFSCTNSACLNLVKRNAKVHVSLRSSIIFLLKE